MASALLPLKTEFRFLSKLCEGIRDKKVECNFVFLSNKSAILKFFEGKCNNDIPYISAKK